MLERLIMVKLVRQWESTDSFVHTTPVYLVVSGDRRDPLPASTQSENFLLFHILFEWEGN